MREAARELKVPATPPSKGARRRKRLHRGVALWNEDRKLCAEPTRRLLHLTLTIADPNPMAAQGHIREFWGAVRHQWLGTRYFCWLELQQRGAVHYHAIWLNPPNRRRVDLVKWVQDHWPHGRTQARFQQPHRGDTGLVEYVQGYVKKMGKKAYQQEYDQLPRELRCFMSQRLEIPGAELEHRLELSSWEYVGESATDSSGALVHSIILRQSAAVSHVERGRLCTAQLHRRARVVRAPPKIPRPPGARGPSGMSS